MKKSGKTRVRRMCNRSRSGRPGKVVFGVWKKEDSENLSQEGKLR